MYRVGKQMGFTLIELLVVIAIIGLLSTVILATLASSREKAKTARVYSDFDSMKIALDLYYDDIGSYPTSSGTWFTACPGNGGIPANQINRSLTGSNGYIPNLAPKYIPNLPFSPFGCNAGGQIGGYIYMSNGPDYKLAHDWLNGIMALECQPGHRFADGARTSSSTRSFCSIVSAPSADAY